MELRRKDTTMTRQLARVRDLAEVPDLVPVLVGWYRTEWEPYYGPSGPGDAARDLAAAADGTDRLPICLVALGPGGAPLGTVSLKLESLPSHRHLSPWIAALLVEPGMRGRGVGTALIEAAEAQASRLGFECLYLASSRMRTYLEGRGYERIDEAETLRERTPVYRLRLPGTATPDVTSEAS